MQPAHTHKHKKEKKTGNYTYEYLLADQHNSATDTGTYSKVVLDPLVVQGAHYS